MANFKLVNEAIKKAYPYLDIQAVKGNGYVYFCGQNGFDNVSSIYSNPTSTSTEAMIRFCLREITYSIEDGKLDKE